MKTKNYIHKVMPLARNRWLGIGRSMNLLYIGCRHRQIIKAVSLLPMVDYKQFQEE